MSCYATPTQEGASPKMFVKVSAVNESPSMNRLQGAPEGVLHRCTHVRVGGQKVPMTPELNREIMKLVIQYGTGR